MPEAEFTHEGDRCSFQVMCDRFALTEPALMWIAEMVHDLDIKDARYRHPETEGVRAMIEGVISQHAADEARIEAASTLFDALMRAKLSGAASKHGLRTGKGRAAQPRKHPAPNS
jgi:hypothetical protein